MIKKFRLIRILVVAIAMIGTLVGSVSPALANTAGTATEAGAQIIGGTPATKSWTVSLQDVDPATGLNRHRCGGTLIRPQWVVTAAHCHKFGGVSVIVPGTKARIGSLKWNSGGTLVEVKKVFVEPNYKEAAVNDIALVKLSKPVSDPHFSIGKMGPADSTSLVAGWGTVCDTDITDINCRRDIPKVLQQLEERRVPNSQCSLLDPVLGELFHSSSMSCLISADGQNRQACFADSGSPIMQRQSGAWKVVGLIVGDGDDATDPRPYLCSTGPSGGPGKVFVTNIAAHDRWVSDTIRRN